jgi:hypothetical protein
VRKYYAKVEFNDRLLDIHATGSSSDFINSWNLPIFSRH